MFFKKSSLIISLFLFFACDRGQPKDPSSYVLNTSVDKKCRSLDYGEVFVSYFNQEFVNEPHSLNEQNEKIDNAFGCMEKVLTQINSEMRGESTNSLSKEELKALLLDSEIQKKFEDLGFQNIKTSMAKLTADKTFDYFMEIKNFVINVVAYFSEGLSSEKVCNNSRKRLYKKEIEILIQFLDATKDFMKEINLISEKVYGKFVENSVSQADFHALSYFPVYEGKYKVRKSLFSIPDNDVDVMRYLFPALSFGFIETEPGMSNYFDESYTYIESTPSPVRYLTWDHYFSAKEQQESFERKRAQKFGEAVSLMVKSNTINSSLFLAKSDMQFIVMMASLSNVLLNAYDRNGDSLITKEEFYNSTSCLEGFLLPLFQKNKEAFYHFVEFQEDAGNVENWGGYYWNKWTGDEDFTLNRGDLSKIVAVIISAFFPYTFFEKDDQREKQILLELREAGIETGTDPKENNEEESSLSRDDLIGI